MDKSFSLESSPSRIGKVNDNVVRIRALFLKIKFVFCLTKILLWVLTRFEYLRIFLWTVLTTICKIRVVGRGKNFGAIWNLPVGLSSVNW